MRAVLLAGLLLLCVSTTASAEGDYAGAIDLPAAGAQLAADQPVSIAGWFVDQTAQGSTGIDEVDVYEGSVFLGRATIGLARPDVAQALGNNAFSSSGFS